MSEAYRNWQTLYNKDVEGIWYSQHPLLRNAAMLFKALDNEFNKIFSVANEKVKVSKCRCNSDDNEPLQERNISPGKENVSNKSADESPDVFLCTPGNLSLSNKSNDEIIISQESNCNYQISPKINRYRRPPKFKRRKTNNDTSYSSLGVTRSPEVLNKIQILKDVVDSTVIETTPEISMGLRNTKSNKITKKTKTKQELNTNLAQMFSNTSSRRKTEDSDSDSTYCPNAKEMLFSANTNSKENIEKLKSKREQAFKEPVVRGKARLKLDGWDCEDCRAFYEKLNLNTQDTKSILNKCSKHRSKFKPHDFTPKYFWNLDFPPTPTK